MDHRGMMAGLLLACVWTVSAHGSPGKRGRTPYAIDMKAVHKDPAFRAGYDDGYRQGANDSSGLSNAYKDGTGKLYGEAIDGYTMQYGDRQEYQKRFRLGYVAGYKAGWDFYAGQFCALVCGGGGP